MTSIILKRAVLKALALFVSKDSLRPAMTGVSVDLSSKGFPVAVATDGHALAAIELDPDGAEGDGQFTIPYSILTDLARGKKSELDDRIVFEHNGNGKVMATDTGSPYSGLDRVRSTREFDVIDEQYPNWRNVVKGVEASGEQTPSQFNPETLMRFRKAQVILDGPPIITIKHNGNRAAVVNIGDLKFFGILMPIMTNANGCTSIEEHSSVPAFAR